MSSTRIDQLVTEVQAAFDRRPTQIEPGLDVEDAALLQLRKGCRLLAGADTLRDAEYYTLVIEASFVAIERTVEFRLLERGTMDPNDLRAHIQECIEKRLLSGFSLNRSPKIWADLWREHRAKTYYQDGLAAADRADTMYELASEIHEFVVGRSRQGHECICDSTD